MGNSPSSETKSHKSFFICFWINLFLGLTSLFAVALIPDNLLINLVCQIVLPFFLAFLLTHDLLDTLTLVTINDIFMAGASIFLGFFKVPMGRGIFLFLTMAVYILRYLQKFGESPGENPWKISNINACILFYALLFPYWLVLYSEMVQEIPRATAFGDIQFILPLLLFFPIRRLVKRHADILPGWIIAVSVSLSIMGLILSLAPTDISMPMYAHLLGKADVSGIERGTSDLGIYRAAMQNTVVVFIGFFAGLFILIDKTWNQRARLLGACLFLLSYSVFVVKFFRGPLLSIFLVLLTYGLVALWKPKLRPVTLRLIALNLSLLIIAAVSVSILVPHIFQAMSAVSNLEELAGDDRVQQGEDMLAAWRDAPVLGQGMGTPLKTGLTRESTGLGFELSYHMLLYRLGTVGFIILMAPLVWLATEFIRKLNFFADSFSQLEGKFIWSLLFSASAICIAGATNPYLKTGFLVLIITIYLVLTENVITQERNG